MLDSMVGLSTAMDGIDLPVEHNHNIAGPVKLPSPQSYDCSESDDSKVSLRLPKFDNRKPLEKDTKDLMTDSNSDQQTQPQQQHLLNLKSSSSCSNDYFPIDVNPPSSQQLRHVKDSLEAPPSAGNRGIKAARQRSLLEKTTRLREVRPLKREDLTSETSFESSEPSHSQSSSLNSSSNMSSASQTFAQQKAASPPVVLLPSQPLHAKNPMSSTALTNGVYNQSSSHGRLYSTFQHLLPQIQNDSSYISSAMMGHKHRAQNGWASGEYLFIKVCDLPEDITTRDLWAAFKHEGHIAYIRLFENAQGYRDGGASVKFRYASVWSMFEAS